MSKKTARPRPKTLRVGHMTYKISYIHEAKWLEMEDETKAGTCWYGVGKIHIRLENHGQPHHEDVLRELLLHEALHACWNDSAMDSHGSIDKAELEEWFVGCLTPPLIQVLSDNPVFADFVLGR